ncbi:MAG: HD domain-containing protein [Acidimicrobiia bacterium]
MAVLFGGGAAVALGANLARPGTPWSALALIGGAIAAGELIVMRPPLRAALPISFAYMVVLARRATIGEATVVLLVAMLATFLVRNEPTSVEARLALFVERMLEGLAAVLVFHGIVTALDSPTDRGGVLFALGCAASAPLIVAEGARMVRERTWQITTHGRTADLALVTSATLMGVSDLGINGSGGMGLWGPLVFTIPLLAAAYSYEHLDEIRRTYDQTIRALGAAPELGGIVRDGHSVRVASLAVSIGAELGFSRHELAQLETAALLHHLGQVCLDEPDDGRAPEPAAVAASGAQILRSTPLLAPAGDIIAAESLPSRERIGSRPSVLSGQVLKVASAFDELSAGHMEQAPFALEALYCAPAYLYDGRVLAALEVVMDRAGLLEPAA